MRYLNSKLYALLALGVSLVAVPGLGAQDAPATLRGDVDGDGRVTRADADAVRAYLVRGTLPGGRSILPAGDANGDGRVTAADAALISRFAAGVDVSRFPVGRPVENGQGGAGGATLQSGDQFCTADVEARTITCREVLEGGAGSQNVILGTPYVTFDTATVFSDDNSGEDTATYTVRIRNAITQPLGTTDGTTLAPGGIRLFFNKVPTVDASTGGATSIRLETPDGTATFTNQNGSATFTNKPYFQYNEVLAPAATSAPRSMRFIYSSNVTTFSYTYRVSAPAQFEHGWITVAPATVPVLVPGGTASLTGTVYDQVNRVQADGITWSSSNTAVATVNASTGEVTAVATGTATITATSTVNAQRTGTRVITVDAAPTVSSTSPLNGATAVDPATDIDITFDESVSATAASFALECPAATPHGFALSGTGTSYTLTPTSSLPGVTTCTVTVVAANVSDTDTNDGPNVMAADYVFSFTTAPVATPDTYTDTVPGNISVNSANKAPLPFSVLENDAVDGSTTVTSAGWNGTPGATENGGTVSILPAGTFTYDPPAGYGGTDRFTYTLSSGSTANVTVTVRPTAVWFVNNNAGPCSVNCGRLSSPFPTLAAFNTANTGAGNNPAANEAVFLYESATKYAGPVTLLPGQKLIGQDATATLASLAGLTLPASAAALPAMNAGNGVKAVIDSPDGVNLATGNTIRGLTLETGTPGEAIHGSNFGTLTLGAGAEADVSIASTGQALGLTTGTIVGTFVSVGSTGGGNNVQLNGVTGDIDFGTGTFSGSTAGAIIIAGGPLTLDVAGSVSTANGPLLDVSGSHTGTLTFTGTSNLQATGISSGLQFNAGGGTYAFNGTTNLAGSAGVSITNGSAGTFTFGTNTSISNPSGIAFNLYGSTAGVTYSGGITKSSAGNAIEIGEHSGGTVTFQTGTINITAGSGMQFSNAGATYNFTGTTTLNGGDAGIDIIGASGGTFNFGEGTSVGATTSPTGTAFSVSGNSAPTVTYAGSLRQTNAARVVDITNQTGGTITFTGTVLANTSSTGIQLSNADGTVNFNGTTTLSGGDAGVDLVSGTGGPVTFASGTTITNPSGTAFNVNGSTPSLTFIGHITKNGTSPGLLVDITNQASGTITFHTGTLSSTSSNGTGIQLSGANGTVNFNGTTTLSNGNNGVDVIGGSTGTITFPSGTAITNPSGAALFVDASAPANLTFAGSISTNGAASRPVHIEDLTGGSITVSGTVTATGQGILLQNNTPTTGSSSISFTGTRTLTTAGNAAVTLDNNDNATVSFGTAAMAISTTSGAGFRAVNGGTVNVTGTSNTVASTTGTAVTVENTTIGGSGITFRSVSANGAVNGIALSSTGSGSFTVTGNGTPASGGTIQNTSGAGIQLANASNLSFTRMAITNTTRSGVNGTGVTNFSFTNSTVDQSGDAPGSSANESSIDFFDGGAPSTETNVSGVVTITGNTLSNALHHGIDLYNRAGTISNLTIQNNTITTPTTAAAALGSGIRIDMQGAGSNITRATIDNNDIFNVPTGVGIIMICGNASLSGAVSNCGTVGSGTDVINITNNQIWGQSAAARIGSEGLVANMNGRGQGNFNVSGNDIRHTTGRAMGVSAFGQVRMTSIVANNVIVSNPLFDATNMEIGADSTSNMASFASYTATVSGNNVSGHTGPGIFAIVRGSSDSLRVKLLNNTVTAPNAVAIRGGIQIHSGSSAGNTWLCARAEGNVTEGSTSGGGTKIGGILFRKEGTNAAVNTYGIHGLPSSPANSPVMEQHWTAANPGSVVGTNTYGAFRQSGSNFVSCSLP